jgi:hypothetical protein
MTDNSECEHEWEYMIEKLQNLAYVRIAQGISGLSFEAMLLYLSKSPDEIQKEIDGVCENSGMTLDQLVDYAKARIRLKKG